jgi:hypothetical protein
MGKVTTVRDDGGRFDVSIDLRQHQADDGPVVVTVDESERRHRQARMAGVVLLVFLNVLDLVTTQRFLDAGLSEGNVVGALFIESGTIGYVKGFLLLALAWRVVKAPPRVGTSCALWFVVGVYAAVVTINTLALRSLGVI